MITENINQILSEIPKEVTLVAVSKTKPIIDLQEAYAWCYVAEKIGNKYSSMASQRSDEILGKILLDSGVSAVDKAKALAVSRYQE